VAIGIWREKIQDGGYAALKDAHEEEGDVVREKDRDCSNNDIALPTLANAVKVGGHGQFDEDLVQDIHNGIGYGGLHGSDAGSREELHKLTWMILGKRSMTSSRNVQEATVIPLIHIAMNKTYRSQ
jgi:hypothetical protein